MTAVTKKITTIAIIGSPFPARTRRNPGAAC
jgi:hypothetical protein